jgi:3-phosphoshikimate 1-carboxyvinyltransferase
VRIRQRLFDAQRIFPLDYIIQPSVLKSGTVCVPGDKSISHRALILGAIADGQTKIRGFLAGEDCRRTFIALRSLGVLIDQVDETTVHIDGVGMSGFNAPVEPLDLGNSGTGMRLLAGLLCGQRFDSKLIGDASLSARPMQRIIEPLSLMGARIESSNGRPPLVIHGDCNLVGIRYSLPIASAQVKSAILLAGLYANGETTVIEPAATRDHTERMLKSMGATLENDNGRIRIQVDKQLNATIIRVPADLSSAAFLILATLIAKDAEVLIRSVGVNPTRTGAIDILREMGADISLDNLQIMGEEPIADIRVRSSTLHGITVDPSLVSLAIDEFPVLFIAAALANGNTKFSGLRELRVKESDRIAVMAKGLREMGINIKDSDDSVEIYGGELDGGRVNSYGDHRVAMSFAVAGTVAKSTLRVGNIDTVNTSFPNFSDVLGTLGVDLSTQQAEKK